MEGSMKKLVLFVCTLTAINAFASSPNGEDDEFDYDLVSNQLEKCLASATNMEAKRTCVSTCYNEARNTVEGNMCAYESMEIEKKEYERVYENLIKSVNEEILAADEYSIEDAKETLARYESYNAILPQYMNATCNIQSLLMLSGSGETSIYVGCQAQVYQDSVKLLLGQE
jgi:hypothetical protein